MHKHKTFIEAMREHPFLYDVSYPAYHNDKKDNAGIQISQQIKNEQAIAYIFIIYFKHWLTKITIGGSKSAAGEIVYVVKRVGIF